MATVGDNIVSLTVSVKIIQGLFAKSIDGKQNSGWILMDFGDIVVNIFNKETREKYNIERVWGDCTFIDFENGEN